MQGHSIKYLSNEDLLLEYQKANDLAFEEFFCRTKSIVYNYLLSVLRNPQDANEAFQNTYLRLHRYISSYDPTQSALGWLVGISKNVAKDILFQRGPATIMQNNENEENSDDLISKIEARETIKNIISLLSEEEKTLLEKRFMEDISYETLAKEAGIGVDGIRQRVSRLVKLLRKSVLKAQ